MVFSLFNAKQKKDDSLILLIDIGSASVGASLARIETGKPPHIVQTAREDIAFQEVVTSTRFLSAMGNALDTVLKKIQGETNKQVSPGHAFCTLSSPWFILRSRQVSIVREKSFIVIKKVLDEAIDGDIEHLKKELNSMLPANDVHVMERKITQMKLNGYDIQNPYGQSTSRVDIGVTISISSNKVVKRIQQSITRHVGTPLVHLGAFPVSAFSAIRDIFPNEQQFIFLDITGEATDVSLIEQDLLVETTPFARGKNYFVRELSSAFKTPHEEAASLFNMFIAHTLEEKKYKQVERIMLQAEKEWVARFEKTLNIFSKRGVLPRSLFFTADVETKEFFERLIKTANPGLFLTDGFEVRHLDQFIVGQFVSFGAEVKRDPFLVVEALLAKKVLSTSKI